MSPALQGVICLHSGTDGALLALIDSVTVTVTAWRTELAAALATGLIAGPGSDGAHTVGVIRVGAQTELTIRGLRTLRAWNRLGAVAKVDLGRE
ncbi:hypothetical protein [Streptomyces noursei]|uniref:hypothetical protein n=1 Tax=Streptomyces noursei TaxID=1971 RepID=UPI0015E06B59|nr:hypothetical protein [Streptomyces noursei]